MTISGSTYSGRGSGIAGPSPNFLWEYETPPEFSAGRSSDDPSILNSATLAMMPYWTPIDICVGGTSTIRQYAHLIIPREPEEPDDAYERRIFHAVLPPFLQRLASQAAGTILRKGIHFEGGDTEFWEGWAKDVTGDGTSLNEFARRLLIDALLYGHSNAVVDFPGDEPPANLAEEMADTSRKPYLVMVRAQQVRGWRTSNNMAQGEVSQVRYIEQVPVADGTFGEKIVSQVRVLEADKWQVWRREPGSTGPAVGWKLYASGTYTPGRVPLVTIYSNRLGTMMSRPPLLEVANLNITYCQRFTDYHHAIHVGAQPVLVLKGFDEDNGRPIGLSVNTAVLLPPDGDAMYVEPTSAAYDSQLKCLQTLEEQISNLGISSLAKQNITNAAAEAKRLDRIDSDSIMGVISQNLAGSIQSLVEIAAKYAGREPPEAVTIPQDYENRLIDGNQVTAYLQLFMQGAIDQETLLQILQEGEVLPAYIDIEEVMTKSQDYLDEQMAREVEKADAMAEVQAEHAPDPVAPGQPGATSTSKGAKQGGVASGKAGKGAQKGSSTLPTPLRPGKHKSK